MRLRGVRIELWVEARDGRPAVNLVMRDVLDGLLRTGASVSVRVPDEEIVDNAPGQRGPHLVLLKSATNLALASALAAERDGVVFVNTAAASVRAHDKAAATATLAAAGVPVPVTYLVDGATGGEDDAAEPHAPWVTKPVRGIHGIGVTTHDDLASAVAIARMPLPRRPVVDDGIRLVQRRVGRGSTDVKVYVAGESVFAARKPFAPGSYADDEHEPVVLTLSEQELVRAAGVALELDLFGLDLRVDGDSSPVVVDANPFPGYRGFPTAAPRVLAAALAALEEA